MQTFLAAHAAADDWQQAANACLAQLADVPPQANLGFLYVTDRLADELPAILDFFKEQTDVTHWVGTIGVAICGPGQEYYDEPAISVLVAGFPPDSFRVFPAIRSDVDEFTTALGDWIARRQARFAIVHGDPRNPRTPAFLADLTEAMDGGFLVGGLTSSRGPHLQIAGQPTQGGLSGVVFASDVAVTTALTQGCAPLGPKHEITECQGNIAVRLDGRPALEVFFEDAGELIGRDPMRAAGHLFAGFPIKGSDTGDYLVRNLLGFDEDNRLLAIGERLAPGDTVMFCRRDARTAYADLVRMLRELKRRTRTAPKGGVYYSCLGRGQQMFGEHSEELKTIQQELGEFPLAGFFANGEISHNRLYGFTGVLTLFL